MNELAAKIESALLLSGRPVSFTKLASVFEVKAVEVESAVSALMEARNREDSGIHVVVANKAVELATNPAFAEALAAMSKQEVQSELTRPQLETLTIVAYRGPITRPEIEYIRGVNCSVILRNLLMRGLIIEKEDATRLQNMYSLSTEMLRHLGLHDVSELPDFSSLHQNARIQQMLDALTEESDV